MNELLKHRLNDVTGLCAKYHVKRLEIFGSAAFAGFDSDTTRDIDFIVEFNPALPTDHADRYFGLLEELELLFCKHIDLVEEKSIKNPFFRNGVSETRRLVYESA